MIRQAISPRLAIRMRLHMPCYPRPGPAGWHCGQPAAARGILYARAGLKNGEAHGQFRRSEHLASLLRQRDRRAGDDADLLRLGQSAGRPPRRGPGGRDRVCDPGSLDRLLDVAADRKSTRLNSSHGYISYAVFCLKKKKTIKNSLISSTNNKTHT